MSKGPKIFPIFLILILVLFFAQIAVAQVTNPSGQLSHTVWNETQNRDATVSPARSGDILRYTLDFINSASGNQNTTLRIDLADVLNLAYLYDLGGGELNGKILSFSRIQASSGKNLQLSFRVQIKSAPQSGDLVMTSIFGNTIEVQVRGSVEANSVKTTEQVGSESPKATTTGKVNGVFTSPKAGADTIFISIFVAFIATVAWFVFKKRVSEV